MKTILALLLTLCLAGSSAMAITDTPAVVNYQGKLLNSSGAQVTDGTYHYLQALQRSLEFHGTLGQFLLGGRNRRIL